MYSTHITVSYCKYFNSPQWWRWRSLIKWKQSVRHFSVTNFSWQVLGPYSRIYQPSFLITVLFLSSSRHLKCEEKTYFKGTVQRDFLSPFLSAFEPAWATDQWFMMMNTNGGRKSRWTLPSKTTCFSGSSVSGTASSDATPYRRGKSTRRTPRPPSFRSTCASWPATRGRPPW